MTRQSSFVFFGEQRKSHWTAKRCALAVTVCECLRPLVNSQGFSVAYPRFNLVNTTCCTNTQMAGKLGTIIMANVTSEKCAFTQG